MIERTIERKKYPNYMAKWAFGHFPKDSGVCRLLVDFYAYQHDESWITMEKSKLGRDDSVQAPAEFWKAVLATVFKEGPNIYASGPKPWQKDRCQYHKHPDGEPKCSA
ncbi:hypothetical protein NA57DRAFT_80316 [Rhizodiscina lignyota]|uniref:Uncharacterized protein n=1 Tax=Rhizodiscina lignyota TaxID=1504668 RepID=A0A9P4M4Q8_9PEZI|nr:hypothetical protein NA57DRAFT_80316 [Rhizodiscina lignyota]